MPYSWECPHCERPVTITNTDESAGNHVFHRPTADGLRGVATHFIRCPNPECERFSLYVSLHEAVTVVGAPTRLGEQLARWQLVPNGGFKSFPDYIPEAIREDYQEACLIRDASPKASATLSRRCLQGIIRDYWKVKPGRLVDEIDAIKDKTDHVTWDAIDAVRQIGNIGAHMEKDINVIVDVDPEEAGLLIALVETLLAEWYVATHERTQRMQAVKAAADAKKSPKAPSA